MKDPITLADVSRFTGQPRHTIDYAICRHGPEPAGRIGITRIWPRADLGKILDSLRKTAVRSTTPERRETAVNAPDPTATIPPQSEVRSRLSQRTEAACRQAVPNGEATP